jgi:hypothetical protein
MVIASSYLWRAGESSKPLVEMGITHNGRTETVCRALTDFGIEDSFARAGRRFEEHYGFRLSTSTVDRVTKASALRAEAYLEEKQNLDAWIRFFLRILKQQKDTLLRKVEREQLLGRLPTAAERLLVLVREHGRITIADVLTLLQMNKDTAKLDLRQLVKQGYLIQRGRDKATWYTLGRTH